MTFSLDTNVVIDLARHRFPTRARLRAAAAAEQRLAISIVVWHELVLGVRLSAKPEREVERLAEVLARVIVTPLDLADVEAAAALRAELRPAGAEIGAYDTLIAGQALARGWTLVTANTKEFDRVRGLNLVDWTRPEEQ